MVLHFHQPVGQLNSVLERVYRNCYSMILEVLEKHPNVKIGLHFSGYLLEWLLNSKPSFVERLRNLVEQGRVEMISGSYYEAILPLIPEEDRLEQIRMHKELLEKQVGYRNPKGFWLAERVWEPSLPSTLAKAGIEYVLIDDYHLRAAGYSEEETLYPYYTEDQGYKVAVFPISEKMRYLVPWKPIEESLSYMRWAMDGRDDRLLVLIADAEKFGEWTSRDWAEKWLDSYFEVLERSSDWVGMVTPSEYLREYGVRGLVYLPSASYDKMIRWSRGHFRNFVARYPESNNMHKKMLWVRRKLLELRSREDALTSEAWRFLYAAQCNDAYWHGMFGGIYIASLRQAVYDNLLEAEKRAYLKLYGGEFTSERKRIAVEDFDYDGSNEVLVEAGLLNLYVKPKHGGMVFELDYLGRRPHNYLNTFTRPKEDYHDQMPEKPPVDWYRRGAFVDHFWVGDAKLEEFVEVKPFLDVGNFVVEPYEFEVLGDALHMWREGFVRVDGKRIDMRVRKKIRVLDASSFEVSYEVTNLSNEQFVGKLGVEHCIAPLLSDDTRATFEAFSGSYARKYGLLDFAEALSVDKVVLYDLTAQQKVSISVDRVADLWLGPIYAYGRTEKGVKRMYNGNFLVFNFSLSLAPRDGLKLKFVERIEEL